MRYTKAIGLALAIALASCASAPPKTVVVAPPEALLQACEEPAGAPQTGREMVTYLLDLRDALRGCAAQMEAVRDWVRGAQKPSATPPG